MRQAALTYRLSARMSPKQKLLIEHAAALEGMSVTDFVMWKAEREARETIQAYEALKRSEQLMRALTDKEPKWMCTCMGGPCSAEEHALRHARYDEQGNRLKNPDGSWFWGT